MEQISQYAEKTLKFIVDLFTPQQQSALAIITISVIIATNQFKIIYFGFRPERREAKKRAVIHLFAVFSGAAGGVVGYSIGFPHQPLWFWIVAGIFSGGLSIGAYKIFRRYLIKKNVISNAD